MQGVRYNNKKMIEHRFSYNNFTYVTQIDKESKEVKFLLQTGKIKRIPKYLFKFYNLSALSVDAITNKYLFSSHPIQINDKYDCSSDLIDYSKLAKDIFIKNLAESPKIFSREQINDYFDSDQKWVLEKEL